MAKTATRTEIARARAKALPARARRIRLAQATTPANPTTAATPETSQGLATAPVTITPEAEPLMTRALAAYYLMGDDTVRTLRARGWEYGDIATAGNIAVRSRRPFAEVARTYEERRDWTVVARDMNVAPEQVYMATNSPRYVMIRPTAQEMERMQMARLEEAYQRTLEQYRQSLAQASPPTNGRIAEASPDAAVPPPAAQADPNTPPPPAPTTPDPTRITTNYQSVIITPSERVASARLELAPSTSSALLRRSVAHYYALPPSTIRELEAQGWSLSDILVAGNLSHRSEASFDEVVALRQGGEEWRGIAERIGVAPEELHMPTTARRVEAGNLMLLPAPSNGSQRQPAPEAR
jgi:hypothetical protein